MRHVLKVDQKDLSEQMYNIIYLVIYWLSKKISSNYCHLSGKNVFTFHVSMWCDPLVQQELHLKVSVKC